jgi:hypothetical protein
MAPDTKFLYLQPAITVSSGAHEGRYVGKTKTRSMLLGAAENSKKEETNPNPNSNPKPKSTRFVSSDVLLNLHSSTIKHVTMWVLLKWRWETGSYLRGHYRYIT